MKAGSTKNGRCKKKIKPVVDIIHYEIEDMFNNYSQKGDEADVYITNSNGVYIDYGIKMDKDKGSKK